MANYVGRQNQAYSIGQPLSGIFPAPIVTSGERLPTVNDHGEIGQIWVNKTHGSFYALTNDAGGTATWTPMSSTTTPAISGATLNITGNVALGSSGAPANTLTLATITNGTLVVNGTGVVSSITGAVGTVLVSQGASAPLYKSIASSDGTVTVTAGASGIDLKIPGGGVHWLPATVSQAMMVNQGYIVNSSGGLILLSLPASSVVGSTIRIVMYNNTNGFRITQVNAAHKIWKANGFNAEEHTTTGAGGYITTINPAAQISYYASIELLCVAADSVWIVRNLIGNFLFA